MTRDKSTIRAVEDNASVDSQARRAPSSSGDAQLSSSNGVDTGVSSIALNASFGGGLDAPRPTLSLGVLGTDSDVEVMLRVKAGDEDAFGFSGSEIPAGDGPLHVSHDAHPGCCGRLGAGSVFTGLSLAAEL